MPEWRRFGLYQASIHSKIACPNPVLPPQPDQLGAFIRGHAFLDALVNIGDLHPSAQTRLADPQIGGELRDRLLLRPRERDRPPTNSTG